MTRTVKLLLLVSLIFCGGTVKQIADRRMLLRDDQDKPREKPVEHKIIEEIPPVLEDTASEYWSEPMENSRGETWTFDLFTAPTITNKDGVYRASLPWVMQVDQQAKFELVTLERKIYPLQYLGFFLLPDSQKHETVMHFILQDFEHKQRLNAEIGDTVTSHNLEILRFEERGPDGRVTGYPKLYIRDNETQREEVLTPQKKYYDHLFHMVLRVEDGASDITLSHIGETFSVGNAEYKLLSVDMALKRATLEQKFGKEVTQIEVTSRK